MNKKILLWLLVFIALISCVSAVNLTNGLVAYYTFDTSYSANPGGNPTMIDLLNNYNVTSSVNTPTWNQTGKINQSWDYEFDNTEYSIINNDNAFNSEINTMCAWIKMDNGCPSASDCQIWNGDDNRTYIYFRINDQEKPEIGYSSTGANGLRVGTFALNSGEWYHVCYVIDVSDVGKELKIYINGSLDIEAGDAGDYDNPSGKNRLSATQLGTKTFDGLIEEIGFWNRPLNATEINDSFNNGSGKRPISAPPVPPPPGSNFSITAKDYYDNSNINTFNVSITNGITNYTFNTTSGQINTTIPSNSTSLWNITIDSNQSGGYYTRQYLNYNVSNNLEAKIWQVIVTFNSTEMITNNSVVADNYTVGSKTNTTTLYLKAGTYNVTFKKTGYYDKIQQFTFSALDNVTRTITNVYNSKVNITVNNILTNASINNFTINFSINHSIYNYNSFSSTTNGYIIFNALKDYNYTINIDPTGHIVQNESFLVNDTQFNFTAYVYTTNSISFKFYDETNNSLINWKTISIELISDLYSNNYSTSNGTLYVDLLSPSLYTMRYSAVGYTERFYYFNLQNRTHTNISLYLAPISFSNITATVYDQFSDEVESAYIKVLRYDLVSNSYILQEIGKTNFEGEAILTLQKNTEYYKFIVEYPLGTVKKVTTPTYIYNDDISFQIIIGQGVAENFYNSLDVSYSLVFNNATNNFKYTWSDANGIASKGCLKVYRLTASQNILESNTCTNGAVGSIVTGVTNISGYSYKADAYVYFNNDEYYLTSSYHIYQAADIVKQYGVFLIVILTLIFLGIGYWMKTFALILTPMPLLIGSVIRIIQVPIWISLGVTLTCWIVAILLSKK